MRRRKSLNLNPLELDDDNSFDESALEREPSMMETVDEDSPSRSQRGGKIFRRSHESQTRGE